MKYTFIFCENILWLDFHKGILIHDFGKAATIILPLLHLVADIDFERNP